jgi:nucleoside-diphosphate-sugar epimerase
MEGKPLPITGSGDETRDFTYVGDIVNGLLAMAHYEEAVGEAFNLGAAKEIRIGDLAKWINEITGNKAEVVFKERRDWDKKSRLLSSIEKARRVLRYRPSREFREGLAVTHRWFKDNWDEICRSADF